MSHDEIRAALAAATPGPCRHTLTAGYNGVMTVTAAGELLLLVLQLAHLDGDE